MLTLSLLPVTSHTPSFFLLYLPHTQVKLTAGALNAHSSAHAQQSSAAAVASASAASSQQAEIAAAAAVAHTSFQPAQAQLPHLHDGKLKDATHYRHLLCMVSTLHVLMALFVVAYQLPNSWRPRWKRLQAQLQQLTRSSLMPLDLPLRSLKLLLYVWLDAARRRLCLACTWLQTC